MRELHPICDRANFGLSSVLAAASGNIPKSGGLRENPTKINHKQDWVYRRLIDELIQKATVTLNRHCHQQEFSYSNDRLE